PRVANKKFFGPRAARACTESASPSQYLHGKTSFYRARGTQRSGSAIAPWNATRIFLPLLPRQVLHLRKSQPNELTDSFHGAFCYCKLLINNEHWHFTLNGKSSDRMTVPGRASSDSSSQPSLNWTRFDSPLLLRKAHDARRID